MLGYMYCELNMFQRNASNLRCQSTKIHIWCFLRVSFQNEISAKKCDTSTNKQKTHIKVTLAINIKSQLSPSTSKTVTF